MILVVEIYAEPVEGETILLDEFKSWMLREFLVTDTGFQVTNADGNPIGDVVFKEVNILGQAEHGKSFR